MELPQRYRGWAFYAVSGLMTASALYFGFWASMDLLARAGLWPDGLFGIHGAAFIGSLTWVDEALFFSQGALKIGALALFLRGRGPVIGAQIGVIATGLWQWVLLSANPIYDASIDGMIFIMVDLLVLGLVVSIALRRG